jgi:hypothetical protein
MSFKDLNYSFSIEYRMGLINLDNYVCSNGVQKTNTYISFANETLYLRQAAAVDGTMTYTVSANYRIFWDEAARNNGLSFIDLKSIVTTIPQDMLTSNMYACLYEELKKIYPNSIDTALRVASAPAPVPVPVPVPVVEAPAPVVEAPAPVVEAPIVEAPAPVVEAPAPVVEAPAPVVEALIVEAPAPVVEAPAPVVEALIVEAPAPVVEAPAPVVEAPAPVVEAPASVVEAPVVEAPAPVVEAPVVEAPSAP